MPKLTIEVTEHDIKNGQPCAPECCPIALAFRERWGLDEDEELHVDKYGILIENGNGEETFRCPMPDAGCRFIDDFDAGRPVSPFTLTLTYRKRRA